jgi:ABC-type glycerol-3-phosphate transport system substrate-binding protein
MFKDQNIFQLVTVGIFLAFAVFGVGCFATGVCVPQSDNNFNYGKVTVWGVIDKNDIQNVFSEISSGDVNIQIKYVEKSEETFLDELTSALAINAGPDVIILPYGRYPDYKIYLYPIPYQPQTKNGVSISEREFRNAFIEPAEIYLDQAGVRAVPLLVDPLVMYWNRDIFRSNAVSNVPEVWDEFYEYVPKMTQTNESTEIIQSTLPFGEYANVTHAKDIVSMLIMQAGAPIISSQKGALSVNVNTTSDRSQPGTEALEFFVSFSNPAFATYNWNRSLPSSKEMFVADKSATYFGYASELEEIQKKNPHLNLDVALVPQKRDSRFRQTYGRLSGIAVLNNSTNKVGAVKTLQLLSGLEGTYDYADMLSEAVRLPPAHRTMLSRASNKDLYMTLFYESAQISQTWPDPNPSQTDIIFENAIEDTISNRFNVGTAVSALERQLEQVVKEYEDL